MFTDARARARARALHSLLLKMFVKFINNVVVVSGHKIWRVITIMVWVKEVVDVEDFLAFHAMHCTVLIRVAKATEETHETRCLP